MGMEEMKSDGRGGGGVFGLRRGMKTNKELGFAGGEESEEEEEEDLVTN